MNKDVYNDMQQVSIPIPWIFVKLRKSSEKI